MNKRTIDADKLLRATLRILSHTNATPKTCVEITDLLCEAMPVVEDEPEPNPTHNLRPLPESEWPDGFDLWKGDRFVADYYGPVADRHLFYVREADKKGEPFPWNAASSDLHRAGYGEWRATPAAALEAAGLPVELLDNLRRPTPAHENPRVIAAAVKMVKEVEQHKAKAAKGREDWLAQFPGWVRDMVENWPDGNKLTPLRISDGSGFGYDSAKGWAAFHRGVGVYDRHKTLVDAARDALGETVQLYADGNVPLWGDEVECVKFGDRDSVCYIGPTPSCPHIKDDSEKIEFADDGGWGRPADLKLLRRHPAIADLPGIRNDSSGDQADSNDSGGGVTVLPDKGTVVADKYGDSVGEKAPKLRVGGRVRNEHGREGFLAREGSQHNRSWVLFDDNDKAQWVRRSALTPIPPPLIDNGDGTWTMEGYSALKIRLDKYTKKWHYGTLDQAVYSLPFDTPHAAAEDLWRRMEGVR